MKGEWVMLSFLTWERRPWHPSAIPQVCSTERSFWEMAKDSLQKFSDQTVLKNTGVKMLKSFLCKTSQPQVKECCKSLKRGYNSQLPPNILYQMSFFIESLWGLEIHRTHFGEIMAQLFLWSFLDPISLFCWGLYGWLIETFNKQCIRNAQRSNGDYV